jgi:hypothetical protein
VRIFVGDQQVSSDAEVVHEDILGDRAGGRSRIVSVTHELTMTFEVVDGDVSELHDALENQDPRALLQVMLNATTQAPGQIGMMPSHVIGGAAMLDFEPTRESEPGCTPQPTGRRALDVGD